jgi:hypothetical protein
LHVPHRSANGAAIRRPFTMATAALQLAPNAPLQRCQDGLTTSADLV